MSSWLLLVWFTAIGPSGITGTTMVRGLESRAECEGAWAHIKTVVPPETEASHLCREELAL